MVNRNPFEELIEEGLKPVIKTRSELVRERFKEGSERFKEKFGPPARRTRKIVRKAAEAARSDFMSTFPSKSNKKKKGKAQTTGEFDIRRVGKFDKLDFGPTTSRRLTGRFRF